MPQEMNYPGIYREEIDNTLISTVDNSTRIATVGKARKGIANSVTLVKSEAELISKFGTPIVSGSYPIISAIDFGIYAGLEVLKETSNLWYVRTTEGTERYSNTTLTYSSGTSALSNCISAGTSSTVNALATSAYPNDESYSYGNRSDDIREMTSISVTGNDLKIFSIGPGVYGNDIAVCVTTSAVSNIPALSAFYNWAGVYGDTVKSGRVAKIDVYVKNPSESFGEVASSIPVETFYVSNSMTDVNNQGDSLFAEDVINGKSQYIYVRAGGNGVTFNSTCNSTKLLMIPLSNGADSAINSIHVTDGVWSFFSNKELYPVDIFLGLPKGIDSSKKISSADITKLIELEDRRLDSIILLQVGGVENKNVSSLIIENNTIQGSITKHDSYFAKYVGWNIVFDRYNASRVVIPNSIYAAAVMARTDRNFKPWEAPAGTERAVIPSGRQTLNLIPENAGRLYKEYNLNTVKFMDGIGNVIWGQKTAQKKQTARDRINVRRMLLYVENNVEKILNNFMFRGNTDTERSRVTALVSSFLQTVKSGDGVQAALVVCDSSNNTADTISRNEMYVDLNLVPTYVTEYIKIRTTINNTSVSVTEA